MFWFHDKAPEVGQRIVGGYSDGSGVYLLAKVDDGYIDSEGYEEELHSYNLDWWIPLPDGFKLWCERRAVDPVTIPDASAT